MSNVAPLNEIKQGSAVVLKGARGFPVVMTVAYVAGNSCEVKWHDPRMILQSARLPIQMIKVYKEDPELSVKFKL